MSRLHACAAAALVFGLAGTASAANVADGSFSAKASARRQLPDLRGGARDIGAWTVGSGSVDLIGSYWQAPPTGGLLRSTSTATRPAASARRWTLASGHYELSFWLAGNPDGGDPLKSVTVTVGDAAPSRSRS